MRPHWSAGMYQPSDAYRFDVLRGLVCEIGRELTTFCDPPGILIHYRWRRKNMGYRMSVSWYTSRPRYSCRDRPYYRWGFKVDLSVQGVPVADEKVMESVRYHFGRLERIRDRKCWL